MKFSSALAVLATVTVAVTSPVAEPWSTGDRDCKNNKNIVDAINDIKDRICDQPQRQVFNFDAVYNVVATPDQVVNLNNTFTGGLPGAMGYFNYGINVAENTICYNITLINVTGTYVSAALTATHIHEAQRGRAGPPRLAFPNPQGNDQRRVSYGCLTGPFKTGIPVNGQAGTDTADGFTVAQIVANAAGFFTDSHTSTAVAGAVRGQLG